MRNLSALVVEDDNELNEIFADILQTIGIQTRQALDGRQALNQLDDSVPDLVMLDMHLPFVSGLDILKRIRSDAALKHITVVVITADALLSNIVTDQADFVLVKPVDFDQLSTLVDRIAS